MHAQLRTRLTVRMWVVIMCVKTAFMKHRADSRRLEGPHERQAKDPQSTKLVFPIWLSFPTCALIAKEWVLQDFTTTSWKWANDGSARWPITVNQLERPWGISRSKGVCFCKVLAVKGELILLNLHALLSGPMSEFCGPIGYSTRPGQDISVRQSPYLWGHATVLLQHYSSPCKNTAFDCGLNVDVTRNDSYGQQFT